MRRPRNLETHCLTMLTHLLNRCSFFSHHGAILAAVGLFTLLTQAKVGGLYLVSSLPANQATGVPSSAAVAFFFREAMDTSRTSASFLDTNFNTLNTANEWLYGNTILICTPSPASLRRTKLFGFSAAHAWPRSGRIRAGRG